MFTYKNDDFKVPVSVWLEEEAYRADPKLVEQTENLARLPFLYNRVVLTPDGHAGYGMPIGGVIATHGYIIPSAVGVDIGCGMGAVKTTTHVPDLETLKKIKEHIESQIPVGFKRHAMPHKIPDFPGCDQWDNETKERLYPIVTQEYDNAMHSIGTLGGGNHFIELQADAAGDLYFMLHSGSRNLGKKVCDHYTKIAKDLNKKWQSSVPTEHDLAFLPLSEEIGQAYLRDMEYCLLFAQANRDFMIDTIKAILKVHLDCDFYGTTNIHHNYAVMENHGGKNVLVHRKGATRAYQGQVGIVPGSQGTKSYIVEGLGNSQSFQSCSHGAGRVMGRKQAQRELDLAYEQQILEGILHSVHTVENLEEAPSAYKDIQDVMSHQTDLCKVLVELRPLAVVKG